MRRQAVTACLLFLTYLAFTIVFTYPLAWHLGTHHVGEAGGDAKSYLWSYWWVSRALRAGVNPFETDAIREAPEPVWARMTVFLLGGMLASLLVVAFVLAEGEEGLEGMMKGE